MLAEVVEREADTKETCSIDRWVVRKRGRQVNKKLVTLVVEWTDREVNKVRRQQCWYLDGYVERSTGRKEAVTLAGEFVGRALHKKETHDRKVSKARSW